MCTDQQSSSQMGGPMGSMMDQRQNYREEMQSNRYSTNYNCHMQEYTNTKGEEYSQYFLSGTDFQVW